MTNIYKNSKVVTELFDMEQIRYSTWIYNERYDFYYDIILTDKEIVIVGKDIVSEHFLSRIAACVVYYGTLNAKYAENYAGMRYDWSYGDGEIKIDFLDLSGEKWRIEFKQARFEEARQFFIELKNKIRDI